MTGIYKIENKINGKIYIGQSINIERRWSEHCRKSKKSLISKAISEFGRQNFSFQILEECKKEELNEKESFYIFKLNSVVPYGYNVREENNSIYGSIYNSYDKEVLSSIIFDLKNTSLTFTQIAENYDLNTSTISRINKGEIHLQEEIQYPIREKIKKDHKKCKKCGKDISNNSIYCLECYNELRSSHIPSKDELKLLIRNYSFVEIGKQFGVSDNAIRKWCKKYFLPHKKSIIKTISNEDWNKI